MTNKDKEHSVDLQHIEFDKDGIVRLALHRKETQAQTQKTAVRTNQNQKNQTTATQNYNY